MARLTAMLMIVALCQANAVCDADDSTCTNEMEAVRGSAMLQVSEQPSKTVASLASLVKNHQSAASLACASPVLIDTHLLESRECLPEGLQEKHLQSVRHHATLLASSKGAEAKYPADGAGDAATLDAAGFKAVTSLCCPPEMEIFFNRLLGSMGLSVCSKPHIQGLMHWFSCVPDMDLQFLIDTINNGNPCKYWAPTGTTCPALSPACEGNWCR